jgi:hypothetical protein
VDLLSIPIATRKSIIVGDSFPIEVDVGTDEEDAVVEGLGSADDTPEDDESWSNHSYASNIDDSGSLDSGMSVDLTAGGGSELMQGLILDVEDESSDMGSATCGADDMVVADHVAGDDVPPQEELENSTSGSKTSNDGDDVCLRRWRRDDSTDCRIYWGYPDRGALGPPLESKKRWNEGTSWRWHHDDRDNRFLPPENPGRYDERNHPSWGTAGYSQCDRRGYPNHHVNRDRDFGHFERHGQVERYRDVPWNGRPDDCRPHEFHDERRHFPPDIEYQRWNSQPNFLDNSGPLQQNDGNHVCGNGFGNCRHNDGGQRVPMYWDVHADGNITQNRGQREGKHFGRKSSDKRGLGGHDSDKTWKYTA